MIQKILKRIFTFNGISITIGIIGSLASILTVFISQWNTTISLKWFVFSIFISCAFILILIKLSINLNNELKRKRINKIFVLRYIPESTTFIIDKTEALGYFAMVSIFFLDDDYETEFGKGYVKVIQNEFIQIKILDISDDFKTNYQDKLVSINNNDMNILKKIVVKSYITYTK